MPLSCWQLSVITATITALSYCVPFPAFLRLLHEAKNQISQNKNQKQMDSGY